MISFIAVFLYLALAALLPVLAYKGIGFGRGLYGALCILSLLGMVFFFMSAAAPVNIEPDRAVYLQTAANALFFLGGVCTSTFIGSLLGVCVYRKPISDPKADKT